MKVDSGLISKFLHNECSDEEADAVQSYFQQNPEELEKYLPLIEWLEEPIQQLPLSITDNMLSALRKAYRSSKRARLIRLSLRTAVAAAVIGLVVFCGIQISNEQRSQNQNLSRVNASVDTVGELANLQLENNSNTSVIRLLPDGSEVTIYPDSKLEYQPGFAPYKREIHLQGKASFRVKKDEHRPFTVYASGVATTALGTVFTVTELDQENVSVSLQEGRVRVWSAKGRDASVDLQPGDNLIVHRASFQYRLEEKLPTKKAIRPTKTVASTDSMPSLVFKNMPLRDVFRKIEDHFQVKIELDSSSGIGDMLFTGTFLPEDDLDFVYTTICRLQLLHYQRTNEKIIISKP